MITLKSCANQRKQPGKVAQQLILMLQGNRCFYCGITLGSFFMRKDKLKVAALQWDHLLPYSYSFNNETENFVAACRQCNQLKNAKVFETYDDAKTYIIEQRQKRGLPVYRVQRPVLEKATLAKILQRQVSDEEFLEISRDRENGCVAKLMQAKCEWCGEPFTKSRPWKTYCSKNCRWMAWNHRNPRLNCSPWPPNYPVANPAP